MLFSMFFSKEEMDSVSFETALLGDNEALHLFPTLMLNFEVKNISHSFWNTVLCCYGFDIFELLKDNLCILIKN